MGKCVAGHGHRFGPSTVSARQVSGCIPPHTARQFQIAFLHTQLGKLQIAIGHQSTLLGKRVEQRDRISHTQVARLYNRSHFPTQSSPNVCTQRHSTELQTKQHVYFQTILPEITDMADTQSLLTNSTLQLIIPLWTKSWNL